uniref:Uncharacterized protein n=1 Tax=viral metagenome TaxID=1070528 RepID=A0A6C0JWL2_9ZZZZ
MTCIRSSRAITNLINTGCCISNLCCGTPAAYYIERICCDPITDNTYFSTGACNGIISLDLPRKGEFVSCAVDLLLSGTYSSIAEIQQHLASYTYQILSDDCIDIFPAVITLHGVSVTYDQPIGRIIAGSSTVFGCLGSYSAIVGFTPSPLTQSGTYTVNVDQCSSQGITIVLP